MHWQGIHTRWSNYEEQFRDGLVSVLTAQCKGCGTESAFPKSSKVNCKVTRQSQKCNLAAVWGQMATGGGCSPLQESIPFLVCVAVMTKKSFMATGRALGKCWWKVLDVSMKSAGQEERHLAIHRGDYHQGIPYTRVNKCNSLLSAYWLLGACFFPGFAPV